MRQYPQILEKWQSFPETVKGGVAKQRKGGEGVFPDQSAAAHVRVGVDCRVEQEHEGFLGRFSYLKFSAKESIKEHRQELF
jgi:hypothetical protein